MEELFVYGTLQDAQVQRQVIGRAVEGTRDVLHGFAKDFVRLGDAIYPIAVPKEGGVIEGVRLLLTRAELMRTDAYEGPDYRRVRQTLGSGRSAWVYVAPGG